MFLSAPLISLHLYHRRNRTAIWQFVIMSSTVLHLQRDPGRISFELTVESNYVTTHSIIFLWMSSEVSEMSQFMSIIYLTDWSSALWIRLSVAILQSYCFNGFIFRFKLSEAWRLFYFFFLFFFLLFSFCRARQRPRCNRHLGHSCAFCLLPVNASRFPR